MKHWWNMLTGENRSADRKKNLSVTSAIANPTLTGPGINALKCTSIHY
jgi:hypothetical protein